MVLGWNGDLKGLDLIYNKLLIMGSETNLSTILLFQFHEMGKCTVNQDFRSKY